MSRKIHLSHTVKFGPTCKSGRTGGSLRGEHIAEPFAEFVQQPAHLQCDRCKSSSLFKFLERKKAAA